MIIIKNVSLFDGTSIQKNKHVVISKSKIYDIKNSVTRLPSTLNGIQVIDGKGNFLIPGFIDIQVNGGGGVFANRSPNPTNLKKIFNAHLKYGTTSIFPTFISDSLENLEKFILAVNTVCKTKNSGILGMHIEGPFLNHAKKGIHPKHHIIPPTPDFFKILSSTKAPHCLVTLAPEMVSEEFIQKLLKKNIHVFAGHTNATGEEIKKAFHSGITGVTHLFNACSQMTARDVGVVGTSLLNKDVLCSLIVDGHHISYDALKIAFNVKEAKKFALISDAMEILGTDQTSFKLFNDEIFLKKNTLRNSDGTLAGAHLTILWAFQNLMRKKLVTLPEAIGMTSSNQAEHFGIKNKGAILPTYDANMLLIDKKNFNLLQVIFSGKLV